MFLSAMKPTLSKSVLIPGKVSLKEATHLEELHCPSESDNDPDALRGFSN